MRICQYSFYGYSKIRLVIKVERLREIREDKDLYQKDIAKILNVSQQTYSRYETGEISIDKNSLIKLADYYNTSIDYLLYQTDERKPYPKSIFK